MSIQQVQVKNVLNLIAQSLYSSGSNPLAKDVIQPLSSFFSKNPTGLPYKLENGRFRESLRGDQEDYNDLLAFMIANIDTLYETCFDHIEQVLSLNTALQNHLSRLQRKRARLEDRIDDYLLGIYNSDGYFHSVSDHFNETGLVDFNYTSAYVDTEAGVVTLPSLASGSRIVNSNKYSTPSITIKNQQNQSIDYVTQMPFDNAVDGLTNTAWYVEVKTKDAGPFTLDLTLDIASTVGDTRISKIEVTPYGVQPVKVGVEAVASDSEQLSTTTPFSNYVKTSADKMVFNAETVEFNIRSIRLTMSKNQYDYQVRDHNGMHNVFMFGIKELIMSEQVYDQKASVVSIPFYLPDGMKEEGSIDGVSITVEDNIPANSVIKYYVAEENEKATSVKDFNWQEINPIGWISDDSQSSVVKFGGSKYQSILMRREPHSSIERLVFEFNTTDQNPAKRNPTGAYFPGVDAYRVASFTDPFLSGTLRLEEGVNTTRIYHTDLDAYAIIDGFGFWKNIFDSGKHQTTHGQIDVGHGFFYGGDVGSNARSVYVETYLNVEEDLEIIQKDCRKMDPNSQLWDLKLYLNGREIANLPVGTNKSTVPWKFNKGRNHIAMIANIPAASGNNSPYVGTFTVMSDDALTNYGKVNLDYWTYVDNYKFVNNQTDEAKTFTIYNDEIVTRKKPTDNFRISFYQPTDTGPDAVRLRADLSRNINTTSVTPILDSYRIRFSYEGDES